MNLNNQSSSEKKSDLSFRLGYKRKELPMVLPLSNRTIDQLILEGRFPPGFKLTGSQQGHLFWDRKQIEEWWETASKEIENDKKNILQA